MGTWRVLSFRGQHCNSALLRAHSASRPHGRAPVPARDWEGLCTDPQPWETRGSSWEQLCPLGATSRVAGTGLFKGHGVYSFDPNPQSVGHYGEARATGTNPGGWGGVSDRVAGKLAQLMARAPCDRDPGTSAPWLGAQDLGS